MGELIHIICSLAIVVGWAWSEALDIYQIYLKLIMVILFTVSCLMLMNSCFNIRRPDNACMHYYLTIGLSNGLWPVLRQTISWTKTD